MVGALSALEVEAAFDVRGADLLLGTSAGSVAAALLGCGTAVGEIRRHHQGSPAPHDPPIAYQYDASSGLPSRPGLRFGSPRLVFGAVRHPRRSSPVVTLSAVLPPGRGTLGPVRGMVSSLAAETGDHDRWPGRRLWIVATDYLSGQRVVFGRDAAGGAEVSLADAVVASCSIPAWYPPVTIGSRPYIDGGATSNTSVDLLRGEPLDEVYVLAPMASLEADRPRSPVARIERAIRRSITRGLLTDVEALRAEGMRVVVVTPGPEDLAVIGTNLMNPRRRTEVLQTGMRTAALQLRSQLAARTPARRALSRAESGRAPA